MAQTVKAKFTIQIKNWANPYAAAVYHVHDMKTVDSETGR